MFLRKVALKICRKFIGEPCPSVISIKLLCNFIEIALWHGCSPVNLLHILRTLFPRNSSGWLLLNLDSNPVTSIQCLHCRLFSAKTHRQHFCCDVFLLKKGILICMPICTISNDEKVFWNFQNFRLSFFSEHFQKSYLQWSFQSGIRTPLNTFLWIFSKVFDAAISSWKHLQWYL